MHKEWSNLDSWFVSQKSSAEQLSLKSARNAIDQKTKPPGSLGQLELLAAQLAMLQNSLKPVVDPARIVVFAGDHGITAEGVSAFPAEVTAQMMSNFAGGGAAVCVLSAANSVGVEVVDVGVNANLSGIDTIVHASIARGTRNYFLEAAMSVDECEAAKAVGQAAVTRAVDDGVVCLGLGEMGIGNSTSAAAIIAMLLDIPANEITGRGTGVDDAVLLHKTQIVQQSINLHRPACTNSMSVLRHVGGFELAAIVGAMIEASRISLPVLVDGFISTAAALVAVRHDASVRRVLIFSHQSAEAGHGRVLEALDANPLLKLSMRLGEGSAAALALPLLRAAAAMLSGMSTFAEAGVANSQ
ncbi:MAG: nicotinate-nucleotide--dimethylbenzimidazole phosphoribosyltransferase [Granulosicoccus sp.]